MRALERRPSRRYENMAMMATDLEDFLNIFFPSDDGTTLKGFFQYLYPLNRELIEKTLAPFKNIYTIEGNYSGQLGKLLQMETTVRITSHIGKTDGRLFTVEDVLQSLTKLGGGKS